MEYYPDKWGKSLEYFSDKRGKINSTIILKQGKTGKEYFFDKWGIESML